MSVSKRVSIKWAGKAYEDSDVQVITIGTHFIDLRIKEGIDWAFAGTLTRENDTVTFKHEIDSRGWHSRLDQGTTSAHGTDELETGEMMNPETGNVEKYEEVWRRIHSGRGFIARQGRAWVGKVDEFVLAVHEGDDVFSAVRFDQGVLKYSFGEYFHVPDLNAFLETVQKEWEVLDRV